MIKIDMAVANVIGSVVFNITLVLGTIFFIAKSMNPERDLFRLDSAWVIVPLIIFLVMIQDGIIGRVDAVIFLFIMVSYLFFLFTSSKENLEGEIDDSPE